MISVRTVTAPLLSARLSLSQYPIKVSYTSTNNNSNNSDDDNNGTYTSFSWGFGIYKIKVLRSVHVGDFGIRYGLKYDAKALYENDVPWEFIVHIHTANMHIKIPVKLMTASPIAWLITFLLTDYVEQQLEDITNKEAVVPISSLKSTGNAPAKSLQFLNFLTYNQLIGLSKLYNPW